MGKGQSVTEAPAQVHVGPWTITVTIDEQAHNRSQVDARTRLFGRYEPEQLLITIQPGLPRDQEADTLLHELVHAVTDQVGLTASPGGLLRDEADAEAVVAPMATALLDLLRRNPDLVSYLTDVG